MRIRTNIFITSHRFLAAFLWVTLLLFSACSDEKTTSTLPPTHPPEWVDEESPDFHGKVAFARGTGSCRICHGKDLNGGEVGISCIDCHIEEGGCTSCHGGMDDNTGAPPYGIEGEASYTEIAVGAHTPHLEASELAAGIACSTCHIVPEDNLDTAHLDLDTPIRDDIAEITWSGLGANGRTVWDRDTGECSGSYCHGNFLGGNASNPLWTGINQAECGFCHDVAGDSASLSLLGAHKYHIGTAAIKCSECHETVVDDELNIISNTLHVNGIVETQTTNQDLCDACHGFSTSCVVCHGGQDNNTGAPPLGLDGETGSSELAVGAHTAHLEGNVISDGVDCTECHFSPAHPLDDGHLDSDGIPDLDFGTLAGPSSSWNRGTATCLNTYCHGNFPGGYNINPPSWTGGSSQAACGSCHDDGGNPSALSGRHDDHVEEEVLCFECHSTTVNAGLGIIGLDIHVNGINEVSFSSGNGTYANGECSNTGCHDTETW